MRNNIVIDVEADGPAPGAGSMIEFAAVSLDPSVEPFEGQLCPIFDVFEQGALDAIGRTREETLQYRDPTNAMLEFESWMLENFGNARVVSWSDNPAFDWQYINFYSWRYLKRNRLGFSMRRIGDLYAGQRGKWNDHTSWKSLRDTRHTHRAVDDATGNAEALRKIISGFTKS